MTNGAFSLRERCGCVVAVTVEDEHLHYVDTVAAWRRSAKRCTVERMTVDEAREELGRTFDAEKLRGKRHWRKAGDFLCRPDLAPDQVIPGTHDAAAEAALATRSGSTR